MTLYKTGRSADYAGSETRHARTYQSRKADSSAEAVEQFERMARGFAPRILEGDAIVWVRDDTITEDQRQWCAETAAKIRRNARIGCRMPGDAEVIRRNDAQIEQAVARILAQRPDATTGDIRTATGLSNSRVLRTEAWQVAHLGRKEAK